MSTPTPPVTPTPDDGDGDDVFAQITSQLTDVFAPPAPASVDTPNGGPAPEHPPERGPVLHPPTIDHTEPAESLPVEQAMARDGWAKPTGPKDRHELAITFPLRHAIKIGFAMTVIAAGVGQTMFFASFFGGGFTGYALAVGIAAFAEVTMIGSGDSALRHKVERNNGWQLLLAVSAAVAVGATTMQVAHWMAQNEPVMALTFGAASLLGWVVHIASGLIAANGHLAREDAYQAELNRRRQKQEALADAARARAGSTSAPASTSASMRKRPSPQKRSTSTKSTKSRGARAMVTAEEAREFSDANDGATAAQVIAHFKGQGYRVPDPRTVRRWLNNRPS